MKEKITVTTNMPTEEQKELIIQKIKEHLESQYNKQLPQITKKEGRDGRKDKTNC